MSCSYDNFNLALFVIVYNLCSKYWWYIAVQKMLWPAAWQKNIFMLPLNMNCYMNKACKTFLNNICLRSNEVKQFRTALKCQQKIMKARSEHMVHSPPISNPMNLKVIKFFLSPYMLLINNIVFSNQYNQCVHDNVVHL